MKRRGNDLKEQKRPEKFFGRLGKDEVSGSNPDSSSRITPKIFGFWVFSFTFRNFSGEYDFLDFR